MFRVLNSLPEEMSWKEKTLTLLAGWCSRIAGQDELNDLREKWPFSLLNLHVFLYDPQGMLSLESTIYPQDLHSKDSQVR